MNNLSWFIYLTQATDSIRDGIIMLWWMTVVVFIAWAIAGSFSAIEDDEKTMLTAWRAAFKQAILPMAVAVFVVAVIPSRQTMLLIAGSEMGERAINSSAVQDVVNPGVDLLKTWIKEETDKLKSAKK